MSERTEVSFDAALMMALRADAQKELDELPSPAQLKERYPDTSRWDARLQAALHKRRPVLKRVLIAVLTLVILTLGALAVSAEFRRAVYTMIQKFLPIEMQLTYQMDGEPLEQLPNGYSDHYVPDGFERDYEQGYDNEISFLHAYVDANDKSIFYYVDCSVIQDYGQIETFDNEHRLNPPVLPSEESHAVSVRGTETSCLCASMPYAAFPLHCHHSDGAGKQGLQYIPYPDALHTAPTGYWPGTGYRADGADD